MTARFAPGRVVALTMAIPKVREKKRLVLEAGRQFSVDGVSDSGFSEPVYTLRDENGELWDSIKESWLEPVRSVMPAAMY